MVVTGDSTTGERWKKKEGHRDTEENRLEPQINAD
jgi:hypothetical protein